MKLKYRPMAIMGFSSLFTLFICSQIDDRFSFVSIGAGIVILLLTIFIQKFRERITPFFLAAALILSGISFEMLTDYKVSYAQALTDSEVFLDATILEEPEFNGTKYYYTVKTNKIDGKSFNVKLRLTAPQYINADPYDRIKLKVTLYEIGSFSKDIKLYYNSKGVFLGGFVNNYDDCPIETVKPEKLPIGYYLLKFRQTLTNRILDGLPNDYGGIIIGMLIGDKSYISDEVLGYIKSAGVAPVFAVSGMHLSVWVMGLYSVLELLKVKKRLNSSIGIGFTFFFMAATGFSPSVCRSGIMLLMVLIGNLFYRKSDPVNSLGFAALVLGLINPMITADIGFLLSFFSTLGIVALNPWFEKHVISRLGENLLCKASKAVLEVVFVSLCATLSSLGLVIVFIGYISLYSILSNLLISYAASLCMLTGGFAALFYPVQGIATAFSVISGLFAKYILSIIRLISDLPFATIRTDNEYWIYGSIAFYTALICAVLLFKNRTAFKISCSCLAATVLVCCLLYHFDYGSYSFVRVLDVDDNIAVVVSDGEHNAVICSDCDYKYLTDSVQDSLFGTDSEVEIMATDTLGGSSSVYGLIRDTEIGKLIVPQINDSILSANGADGITEAKNAKIKLWAGANIEFVSLNGYSVAVCRIDGISVNIILRDGDIPEEYLKGDILICENTPQNADFKKIIISGESDSAKSISTESYGDIEIKIKDDKYKIIIEEGN